MKTAGLVELLIATLLLTIAVSALLAVLTASALSLQRSAHNGTALSLANQQLELYRRLGYDNLRLRGATLPAKIEASCPYTGSDPYVTANCSDSSIPAVSNLVVDATTAAQIVAVLIARRRRRSSVRLRASFLPPRALTTTTIASTPTSRLSRPRTDGS